MKWLILLILLPSLSFALDNKVTIKVGEAISKLPTVKLYMNNTKDHLGITDNHTTGALITASLVAGKLDTRMLTFLRYRHKSFEIQPRIIWDMRNSKYKGFIQFSFSF